MRIKTVPGPRSDHNRAVCDPPVYSKWKVIFLSQRVIFLVIQACISTGSNAEHMDRLTPLLEMPEAVQEGFSRPVEEGRQVTVLG